LHILIVKLSSIGDIVHALPSLAAIRRALPEAEISWVVEESVAEILRHNPLIDNLIEIDTRTIRDDKSIEEVLAGLKQIKELRRLKPDVAIDFQGLLKSAAIAKLSGARRRFGFSGEELREPASRFLLTDTLETPPRINVIRKNLALAAAALEIDVADGDLEFAISTTEDHRHEAESIIEGDNFAILNPGGGWPTKLWPAENFGELADLIWNELQIVPVLTTGPNETDLAKRASAANKTGKLIQSQPSLKGFYELAKRARVYIGGDTGPTHIAVAAATPIVGIYGPTQWWRNGSPNHKDICVQREDVNCCGRRVCSDWVCMDIEVGKVLIAVKERIRKSDRCWIAPV